MANIWLSKVPDVSKVHHQFEIHSPRSCQGEGKKIANARKQLSALKAKREEISSMSPGWEAKVVLALTLTKETCYSFVDLAGSVSAIVMPKKQADQVKAWSDGLTGIMDMTEAAVEDGSALDFAKAGLKLVSPDSVAGKTAKYKAGQGISLAELQDAARRKNKQDIGSAQQDLVLGNTEFISDLSEEEMPKAKYFKSAVSILKSASRYNQRLEKAFDEYLAAGGDPMERGAEVFKITREIKEIEKRLGKALVEFQSCLDRSDASHPKQQKGTSTPQTTPLN